ncbi:MAG: 4Fe-4S dicluster domain-containing protein [Syntrophomonadaceae bacterium]|nr:4Fe-4S dicluster domain-containing protein [Syntrophomonadaceae bacterium]
MNEMTLKIREIARDLLERGEVKRVIGWEKGTFFYQSTPFFAETPADTDRLIWDDYCLNNLAVYLLDFRYGEEKVALFVKGCDSRGVVRLIQDQQFPRERVYLIGIPCPGLKDAAAAANLPADSEVPLAEKCRTCTHKNPVLFDILAGPQVPAAKMAGDHFAGVRELEAMDPEEKFGFWQSQYGRCIRCYVCRNACPACNCRECIFDQTAKEWLSKEVNGTNNQLFGMIRAFHVAGRCIDCGECERVCPMDIPIMRLNRKVIKDINELFGDYEAGTDLEKLPPLGLYSADDPEEFM